MRVEGTIFHANFFEGPKVAQTNRKSTLEFSIFSVVGNNYCLRIIKKKHNNGNQTCQLPVCIIVDSGPDRGQLRSPEETTAAASTTAALVIGLIYGFCSVFATSGLSC
ncbi:DUF829 domain-containing protein [Chitinophaga sp. G-6-1-13]|uniref:DUF829 domain-containing protein n=1 Tax=Chitinophaga fulva TaxID=2728842 RepID=A0A848GWD4_9BACT|nr:DUF829 domain-containing protein [Chitinophaga fulva]